MWPSYDNKKVIKVTQKKKKEEKIIHKNKNIWKVVQYIKKK